MTSLEYVWRLEAPHVLRALIGKYRDFDGCEDALQDALLEANEQWPTSGVPDYPRGWLIRTASRRYLDAQRQNSARLARELKSIESEVDSVAVDTDDTLQLFFLCAHPTLSPTSQLALMLRALGGLTTAQIAAAFLVPESTMGQRISRAKSTLREHGIGFQEISDSSGERLAAVRHSLYLIFNEGYTASSGEDLMNISLAEEAIRLCRELFRQLPNDSETAGLLALMLLTNSRVASRVDSAGDLVPLAEQDRSRWDQRSILEAVALLEHVLPLGRVGRFQLEAAISAVHAEAESAEKTDWLQIVLLYELLDQIAPNPLARLGHAVAVAMVSGPDAGLKLMESLELDDGMQGHHRRFAVRGHLLEMAMRYPEAVEAYREAARLTRSLAEQRYLNAQAAVLASKVE